MAKKESLLVSVNTDANGNIIQTPVLLVNIGN